MQTRLDAWLAENNMAKSREKAKELIKNNCIKVNGETVSKPSFSVSDDDKVEVVSVLHDYVGRGGLKLEKAVRVFNLDISDLVCVDLGASTGGFTDCLLKNGAAKVFAVDVGHGQLDEKLLSNPKVVNLEGVNVKAFSTDYTGGKVDFLTADLSFISIKSALPTVKSVLKESGKAVILIKPQFEVGKKNIGKGGIVKDKSAHVSMFTELIPFIEVSGFTICGLECSVIKGGDGNIEYIAFLENNNCTNSFITKINIKKFVADSFEQMNNKGESL